MPPQRRNNIVQNLAHIPPAPTMVKFSLTIPTAIYDHYAELGIGRGKSAEEMIEERLLRCKDHNSLTPLYFNDQERSELEHALGHNCASPGVALAQLKNAVQLKVGEVLVELQPRLQQRIKSRVFRGEDYAKVVRREVVKGLEVFAGMRPA